MRRKVKLFLMLGTLLLLVTACSSESKQTQPVTTTSQGGTSTAPPAAEVDQRDNALVRVINAVPGNASLDIFAGDQMVFEAVAFKTVTPYKELPDDRHNFRVRHSGHDTAQPVVEEIKGLTGGRHYTIVMMPGAGDQIVLNLINDNITDPPADKAQVRVIHASPDAGEVDIVDRQGNKELFSGVNFESQTSYLDVDPTKTTLEVRQEGQDRSVLNVPNANFEKGKFYTIVVTGRAKGTPSLQALMVEDQLGIMATASKSQDSEMVKTGAKY